MNFFLSNKNKNVELKRKTNRTAAEPRPSKTIHEALKCESEESHEICESRRRRRPAAGRGGRPNRTYGSVRSNRAGSVAAHTGARTPQLHPGRGGTEAGTERGPGPRFDGSVGLPDCAAAAALKRRRLTAVTSRREHAHL